MKQKIISKIAALFFLSFPLGFGCFAVERDQQWAVETLSHSELVKHLNANRINSPYEVMAMMFFIGLLYIGLVESCAYAFRAIWQKLFKGSQQRIQSDSA